MRTWEKGPLTPCTLVLPLAVALVLLLALPVLCGMTVKAAARHLRRR
jgi:hypothetical protein